MSIVDRKNAVSLFGRSRARGQSWFARLKLAAENRSFAERTGLNDARHVRWHRLHPFPWHVRKDYRPWVKDESR